MSPGCRMQGLVEADRDGRLGPKEAASVARHLRSCAECRALVDDLARLVELGQRSLQGDDPSPLEHRRKRLRLLRDAVAPPERSSVRRRPWLPLLASAAACAVVIGIWQGRPATPGEAQATIGPGLDALVLPAAAATVQATVRAAPRARFERHRQGGIERVRLRAGAIDVQVSPLPPGHRFVVATADAEVEVRGTDFLVRAAADRLVEVVVREGQVEVRKGDLVSLLAAGQSWRLDEPLAVRPAERIAPAGPGTDRRDPDPPAAPATGAGAAHDVALPRAEAAAGVDEPSRGAASTAEEVAAAPSSQPATPPTRTATKEFAQAVALLEQKSYREAAKAFRSFGRRHHDGPQAEDADFLAIVALQHAGRHAAAVQAARHYLARHPQGARRAEAAAIARRRGSGR